MAYSTFYGKLLKVSMPDAIRQYDADKLASMLKRINPDDRNLFAAEIAAEPPQDWEGIIEAGLHGSTDDAESAIFALPNYFRGLFAVAAYALRVPVANLNAIVRAVWDHDHKSLMRAVQDKRIVRAIMRRAECVELGLPETFTVYRGTTGITRTQAAKGLAWTTSPEVACWFSGSHWINDISRSRPLVIEATASRSDVEPPRICRRRWLVSHAAISMLSASA